jgi:small subunit ribosomal protein S17e
MGNIRPKYIKRIAKELLEKYPTEFSEDFQFNKNKVGKLTDVSTKIMRNRIAGYLTRYYIKMQKHAL